MKTLRAVQPLSFRALRFRKLSTSPKQKEPPWAEPSESIGDEASLLFQRHWTPLEQRLVNILDANGYSASTSPVIIQSFEVGNLKELNTLTDVRLVQLFDAFDVRLDGSLDYNQPYDFVFSGDPRTYGDLATQPGLAEIATYADGIGPWKRYIVTVAGVDANSDGMADDENGDGVVDDADRFTLTPSSLLGDAHLEGLFVHAYTFRDEGQFLASNYGGDPIKEYVQFFRLGVDGVFSDQTDSAMLGLKTAVPEPRTLLYLAVGLGVLMMLQRRTQVHRSSR
jgi:glycerophosphoryl diester phosphodiesterase